MVHEVELFEPAIYPAQPQAVEAIVQPAELGLGQRCPSFLIEDVRVKLLHSCQHKLLSRDGQVLCHDVRGRKMGIEARTAASRELQKLREHVCSAH